MRPEGLDEIASRVEAQYERLLAARANRSEWTQVVKSVLVRLGHDKNLKVCATPQDKLNTDGPEWLYDAVWYREEGADDDMTEVPLVAEVEWSPVQNDVDGDFQKLLLARSPLKVWVFWTNYKNDAVRLFGYCERARRAFRGTEGGSAYLLLGCATDGCEKRVLL